MSKNENGYPTASVPEACGTPMDKTCPVNELVGGASDRHGGCGGRGDCLDSMPLAYVYAPDQQFRLLYSAKDALRHGTLFEELFKPMGVYGNER